MMILKTEERTIKDNYLLYGEQMENILDFFRENEEAFIVYVVEQRFATGRGLDYFKSFKGKPNLIDSNIKIRRLLRHIIFWISRHVPSIGTVIGTCFGGQVTALNIADVICALSKLFSVESHQAAGPDVIDPIIIEEGNVFSRYLTQLVNLHKESILRPTIIVILRDNDFERAKKILSECPDGTCLKLIRNSGESTIYRVVNSGAENVDDFIDSYSRQCFNTCSNTKRDILLNEVWQQQSIVHRFAPSLMKERASLICDEKKIVRDDITDMIQSLRIYPYKNEDERKLCETFLVTALLNQIFCHDNGGTSILDALDYARDVGNSLLLAQVYRYAHFIPNIKHDEEIDLLKQAKNILEKNQMMDQAIYCQNNILVRQFETDNVSIRAFRELKQQATYDVPGLVGMSHIYNNVGVAQLMCGFPEDAITSFDAGLDYARSEERVVQRLALLTNRLIAYSYNYIKIPEEDFYRILNLIRDGMARLNLPFLSARYVMNTIVVAYRQSPDFGKFLLERYRVYNLVQQAFDSNKFGTGQLFLQISRMKECDILKKVTISSTLTSVTGMQKRFIEDTGFNPVFFSTWI